MKTVDFAHSFLTFSVDLQIKMPPTVSQKPPVTANNARIALEAVCDLLELSSGRSTRFVLGASCKSEQVGLPRGIWMQPNADFCVVASMDEYQIIKSFAHTGLQVMRYPESLGPQPDRQVGLVTNAWTGFRIDVTEVEGTHLATPEAIITATLANNPLVARLSYQESGYRVQVDHPVKTMNAGDREMVYQTDTGPIAVPDFSKPRPSGLLVESFELAFEAFNASDWAELLFRVPVPVPGGTSVTHYSLSRRIERMNNAIIQVA